MPTDQLRCFIAIELPAEIKQNLEQTSQKISQILRSGWRWTPVNSIHLTLKFLGDTSLEVASSLRETLSIICSTKSEFYCEINGVGTYPNIRQPRILWAGIKASQQLLQLQKEIDAQTSLLGFPLESRLYSPHLTLARSQPSITLNDIKILAELLRLNTIQFCFPFQATRVTLFQSLLRPQGPIYTPLAQFPLNA